jgi:hypothetical protein
MHFFGPFADGLPGDVEKETPQTGEGHSASFYTPFLDMAFV